MLCRNPTNTPSHDPRGDAGVGVGVWEHQGHICTRNYQRQLSSRTLPPIHPAMQAINVKPSDDEYRKHIGDLPKLRKQLLQNKNVNLTI